MENTKMTLEDYVLEHKPSLYEEYKRTTTPHYYEGGEFYIIQLLMAMGVVQRVLVNHFILKKYLSLVVIKIIM